MLKRHTVRMEDVTSELHLWWTQWIVGGKSQRCRKNSALKRSIVWAPNAIKTSIIFLKLVHIYCFILLT